MTITSESIRRALRNGSDPYESGEASFFADLVRQAQQKSRGAASVAERPTDADLRYEDAGRPEVGFHHQGQDYMIRGPAPSIRAGWQRRLDAISEFRADITSGTFVPTGAPTRVANAFAEAVAARAVVAPLLNRQDLPPTGLVVEEPRVVTGPSVAVQAAEGDTASETDPTTTLESVDVVTVTGKVDLSRQLFDRSAPAMDRVIAAELGRKLAEHLDELIVSSTTAPVGLLSVTGATAVTYTDTTPTRAEFWSALMETISDTSTAWKNVTGTVLMHLRRLAWLYGDLSNPPRPPDGVRFVPTGAIPTNLGGGTEDAVVIFDPNATRLYIDPATPVRFLIDQQSLSGTLQVRVVTEAYLALSAEREPASIGLLTGSGLAAPVFA